MRVYACFLLVAFFSIYAYKRWFVSLCVALALMAVLEHPDMPKSIAGIQGLNLWNILIANIVLAWAIDKNKEGRVLDLPTGTKVRFILFLLLILFSTVRMFMDPGPLAREESPLSLFSEYVINCFKWLIPCVLVFDGCRERRNMHWAMASILAVYFLLAVQVIRWMPLSEVAAASDSFARRSYKVAENEIGYNRVTLSMMLGGGSWAMLCTLVLLEKRKHRMAVLGAGAAIVLGQALTGGRTGYACWLLVGMCLAAVRWRKLLLLIPIAIFLVFTFVPAVRDRMLQGIVGTEEGAVSHYEVTSGRNIAWPIVIDHIKGSILVGYGRQAMVTEGLRDHLWDEFGESFPHPHNAYLEALLDGGIVGLVIVLALFTHIVRTSYRLLRSNRDPIAVAVGGMAFSLSLALMFGSLGGQTFYPREGAVCLWASIGLMFRVAVQLKNSAETGQPLFLDDPVTAEDEPALEPATVHA